MCDKEQVLPVSEEVVPEMVQAVTEAEENETCETPACEPEEA